MIDLYCTLVRCEEIKNGSETGDMPEMGGGSNVFFNAVR